MDFAVLPPEVNSARMYAGSGAGPMLAAAAAWDGLAAELHSAAASDASVISGLTSGSWSGPASVSMAAAAAPYVAWMTATATQAEQTAVQAKAAVAAYEAAFAMTVPPMVVAANRSLLMSLVATNILGQNTPAIAATEAHYAEMWAQDITAMYAYAGASAAASTLTPFTPPQNSTNPAGLVRQGAAVAQATDTSAATDAQATVSQLMSTVPNLLHGLASPLSSTVSSLASPVNSGVSMMSSGLSSMSSLSSVMNSLTSADNGVNALGTAVTGLSSSTSALGSAGFSGLSAAGGNAAVSAGLGRTGTVGALSVPQSWAAAAPAISPAGATALAGSALSAAPAGSTGAPAGMLPMLANATRGGGGHSASVPRLDFRPTVIPHSPSAG